MNLNHHKILITGGTRGIGLALAQKFVALDNHVIVTGRNIYRLEQLKLQSPNISIFRCDMTNPDHIYALIIYIEKEHPDLNILINNAGVQFNYELMDNDDALYKVNEEIATNLIAPIHLTSGLLKVLSANASAAIVNVSSALAFVPKQSAPIYSATKAAIHNFSKTLRYQLEGRVKVFELIPSLVDTDMTAGRGNNKISPKVLVDEFISNFKRDRFEINIGKVKFLRFLHRIYPSVADRLMRNK